MFHAGSDSDAGSELLYVVFRSSVREVFVTSVMEGVFASTDESAPRANTRCVMRHYFHRDQTANIHVDTMLDGQRWQHHVHTEAEFACWSELMGQSEFIRLPDEECTCDLAVGQVLEHDGRIWNHPQFL